MFDSPEVDECERCGATAPGRRQWMVYGKWRWLMGSGMGHEFYCERCLRVMRTYAISGFSLLGLIVAGFVGVTIWLMWVI